MCVCVCVCVCVSVCVCLCVCVCNRQICLYAVVRRRDLDSDGLMIQNFLPMVIACVCVCVCVCMCVCGRVWVGGRGGKGGIEGGLGWGWGRTMPYRTRSEHDAT